MVFKRRDAAVSGAYSRKSFQEFLSKKRAQVTIFIIIAILLIAAVLLFFFLRPSIVGVEIPVYAEPVYTSFSSCVEDAALTGVKVLESQAGYIYLPEFEPGSQYMPFSSQLNFLGNPTPYWFYVSGNNIAKEQVPTKGIMEAQLGSFVEDKIASCNYDDYYEQGFEISWTEPASKVEIEGDRIKIELNTDLNIALGDESVVVRDHKIVVDSKLGSLYDSAVKIYNEQQKELFLEGYAMDVLWNYAPVDGTEITCSPLIWDANEVFDELQEAIEANSQAMTNNRQIATDDYFFVELPVREEVRFLNSRNWTHSFEVTPSEGSFLVSSPIGIQQGLGVLGFCYVPYHYVYDMKFPVMVQVQSGDEIFQFPIAVIIQGNNAREPLEGEAFAGAVSELCKYKNTEVNVDIRDRDGNPVKADISFECFGDSCFIGQASDQGSLVDDFPQCVNGFVSARAQGFKESRYLLSTVSPGSVDIIMEKLYRKEIQLKLDNVNYGDEAIIYFTSDDSTKTIVYPEQRTVELAEGQYEIQVYIFHDTEINIGEMITEQCVEVPKSGVLGVFGMTYEKCFDVEVPEQIVSQALAGGGTQNYFVLESELKSPGVIEVNAESLPVPENMDQLQTNYMLFETKGLDIIFK